MPSPRRWPPPAPTRFWSPARSTSRRPPGVKLMRVTTAREMLAACEAALPADVAVLPRRWPTGGPNRRQHQDQRKPGKRRRPLIKLVENPDILATLANESQRPQLVIGFAAETDDVVAQRQRQAPRKGCDWIVANDVSPRTASWAAIATASIWSPPKASKTGREMTRPKCGRLAGARIAEELGAERA